MRIIKLTQAALIVQLFLSTVGFSSDHGEGHIGDFYAFEKGDRIVLVMTITSDHATSDHYHFSNDVAYTFHVSKQPKIGNGNDDLNRRFGGQVQDPGSIKSDLTFQVSFDQSGLKPKLKINGIDENQCSPNLYAGLRDDPFIRGGLQGKNILAIVLEIPKTDIISEGDDQTILCWSTTEILSDGSKLHDHCGHPYYSQRKTELNGVHPSEHKSKLKLEPDVLIFNTSKPAKYPNGRSLFDDVVDYIPDVNPNDPNPSTNDVPFLTYFPYLAASHFAQVPGDLPGPKDPFKIHFAPLAVFDLEDEIGMPERKVRIRYWIMAPDGIIMNHEHKKRPAIVYLLDGEVIETKMNPDGSEIIDTIRGGEATLEPTDIEHWWVNQTDEMVRMVAVDIPEPADSKKMKETQFDITKRDECDLMSIPANPTEPTENIFGAHDLEKMFPEIPELKGYKMRARTIAVSPTATTPIYKATGAPAIIYIINGDILEYRSDQIASPTQEALIRRENDFSIAQDKIEYFFENPTSEETLVLIIDFVKE